MVKGKYPVKPMTFGEILNKSGSTAEKALDRAIFINGYDQQRERADRLEQEVVELKKQIAQLDEDLAQVSGDCGYADATVWMYEAIIPKMERVLVLSQSIVNTEALADVALVNRDFKLLYDELRIAVKDVMANWRIGER